ncbi:MAG: GGDEF domain-containing protein [Acidobacteria bacterium]|nr:GGDEF domain-containing protein [Acidobacteriota bacterium]
MTATLRQAVSDTLKQQADVLSKDELIGLQSVLHATLDQRICRVVKESNERRFRYLNDQAWHDSLTGLLNRAAFEQRLNEEVARALRHRRDLTLVMFDVDGFKSVNDTLGHQAGDKALSCVAGVLRSSFRLSDPVFRYGGDEFVALCPETSGDVIENALPRITDQLLVIGNEDKFAARVSISWGIASLPTDAVNAYELIRLADQRLYDCKQRRHESSRQSGGNF